MSSASTARHAWARDEWKPLGKNQTRVGKKTEKIEARPCRAVSGRRDGLGYEICYSISKVEISPGIYIYIYIAGKFDGAHANQGSRGT